MWPIFLYMRREDCLKSLRHLELDAYSMLVSALRAQGPLTQEKRKILKDAGKVLNINLERHKCEVRRAVNDERLNTIAYHMSAPGTPSEDWCLEGRRLLPMLQRISPQTLHPIIASNLANTPADQESAQKTTSDTLANSSYETVTKANSYNGMLEHQPKARSHRSLASSQEPFKKMISKNQKLMVTSTTEAIPTNSILHKTLSLPVSKITTVTLDKFKIVPTTFSTTVTSKYGKKMIPLSQLQMLNRKLSSKGGIKVLPISSKIFGKNITMTTITNQHGLKTSILQHIVPDEEETPKVESEVTINNEIEEICAESGNDQLSGETDTTEKLTAEAPKSDESETLEGKDTKIAQGDLASLMEMDPSEFIEPELQEPLTIVNREP